MPVRQPELGVDGDGGLVPVAHHHRYPAVGGQQRIQDEAQTSRPWPVRLASGTTARPATKPRPGALQASAAMLVSDPAWSVMPAHLLTPGTPGRANGLGVGDAQHLLGGTPFLPG